MALGTRTILVHAVQQVSQRAKFRFLPELTGDGDDVLLERYYEVETDPVTGVGSIDLPVKASGTITYRFEISSYNGTTRGKVNVSPGDPISLGELILSNAPATDPLKDYVDLVLSEAVTDLQRLSEKGEPDGYCPLDTAGFIAPAITGWNRVPSEGDGVRNLRPTGIISKPVGTAYIYGGNVVQINKNDGISNFDLVDTNGEYKFDTIWSDGGEFIDGDELYITNVSDQSIVADSNGPTNGDGYALLMGTGRPFLVWPTGQTIKCVFDSNEERFRVLPLFSSTEITFGGIDDYLEGGISEESYWQFHNVITLVSVSQVIELSNNIPDGFRADFMAMTSDPVGFAVVGGSIANRQGHTQIAGRYGVVTVLKAGGQFFLLGDTAA